MPVIIFDTANNVMKVYGSSGFTSAGSSVNGTRNRSDYVVGTHLGRIPDQLLYSRTHMMLDMLMFISMVSSYSQRTLRI